MPTKNEKLIDEYFFNFEFRRKGNAVVNGVNFQLPSIPFTNPDVNLRPPMECKYDTMDNSSYNNDTEVCKFCPHAVYIHRSNAEQRTTQFVFSSLDPFSDDSINESRTHPIHLHGHSFFVTKIGYAKYDQDGFINEPNRDVTVKDCGPGNWTDEKTFSQVISPKDLYIDQSTVRKDVITVPAGGSVVIEFLRNHSGWWFLHCHIDAHLTRGMAIAVGELPECQVPFASPLPTDESFDYELSTSVLKAYENYDKCNLQSSPYETCENDKEKDGSLSFDETHSSVKREFPRSEEGMSKSVHEQDEKHLHNLRRQMFNLMKNGRVNYGHVASSHYRRLYHYYNSPQADKLKYANQKMSEPSKNGRKNLEVDFIADS
ncbi:uncharacterized protein LOC124435941 [Xenia sp. Carnegie-2017]|uniref:uncharacterized protein LOC124435941 n=1 Tax=Xenia sp. Carnegie-2017 TaxID=2897299 RepID=UPI001F0380BF|nr:uncharacterized protein LOC124435941 [Xenia sp. Carnegie-2017]